jgi:hypothetical protein
MKSNFGWLVLSTSRVYPDPEHRSAVTLWLVPSARNEWPSPVAPETPLARNPYTPARRLPARLPPTLNSASENR